MIEPYKTKLLTNLKKTRGLIETIEKMVENDRYCMDIAQQINASLGLMKSAKDLILQSHLSSCASHKLMSEDKEEKERFIQELMDVFHISHKK
ncbi:MAG: metal-sensitive transcriptional regulator [Candidatus Gracilibacteria bacterium]|nr:metal-sensitive transcriptional regulator [Candidatus Gracilibacteria bacterium]